MDTISTVESKHEIITLLVATAGSNAALLYAARSGDMVMVNQCIEAGATSWNWGMCGALAGKHFELAKLFDEKGVDDYDEVLAGALGIRLFTRLAGSEVSKAIEDGGEKLAQFLINCGLCDSNQSVRQSITYGMTNWLLK